MIWYLYIKRKKRQTPRHAIVTQKLLSNKLGFQCWVYHSFINCHLKCKIPCILEWSLWRPPRDGWSLMFCIELSVCCFAGHWRLWFFGVKKGQIEIGVLSPTPDPHLPLQKKKEIKPWITAWLCDGPWSLHVSKTRSFSPSAITRASLRELFLSCYCYRRDAFIARHLIHLRHF